MRETFEFAAECQSRSYERGGCGEGLLHTAGMTADLCMRRAAGKAAVARVPAAHLARALVFS